MDLQNHTGITNHSFIVMNESLIRQYQIARLQNPDINNESISIATGIHKSTVSEQLTSKKRLSIEQAKLYAKYFKVHLVKVLDDSVVKYRVVKYIDNLGEITDPTEEDFDVILAPNELENTKQYCIYDKEKNTIYWYNPKITCKNTNLVGKYTYIKSNVKSYLGVVLKENKGTVTFVNRHTNKTITTKCIDCHPITAITFCDFSTATKINHEL